MRRLDAMFLAVAGACLLVACGDDDGADSSNNGDGSNDEAAGGSGNGSSGNDSTNYTAQELAAGACEQGESDPDCDIQPYVDCMLDACSTQYETCLGANYMAGDFSGGACEGFMECVNDAPNQCDHDCTQDQACESCFSTLGSCALSNCASELSACTGGVDLGGDVGAIGGATCADLEACCASMSGEDAANCESGLEMVRPAGDIGCGVFYATYQLSGLCP